MRTATGLDGTWKLQWFEPDEGEALHAHAPDHNDVGWIDADVPGEVHRTLMQAGAIRGHVFDKSHEEHEWVTDKTWWYRKAFSPEAPARGERVELVFDGLDTLATVYLNGRKLATHENMFRELRLDVTDKLAFGRRNVLAVSLAPAKLRCKGMDMKPLYAPPGQSWERLVVRKAQVSFGWDFCGRMITTGIWQSVRLERYRTARIESVQVIAEPDDRGAGRFDVQVETVGKSAKIDAAVREVGASRWSRATALPGGKGRLTVKDVKLWWPWAMGKQNRYEVRVRLRDRAGKLLDEQTHRVGVRKVELVTDPIEDGNRFAFRINGREMFLRGANWVPPTPHFVEVDRDLYHRRLIHAVEGNLDMLRIWGGGVYEQDSFYDLCDELGILLMHDFMWACGVYPQDKATAAEARQEAEFQLKRLRNHPSIVLWCGNNENDMAYYLWDKRPHEEMLSDVISRKVLPNACKRLDPTRPYIPSSPYSELDESPISGRDGDTHRYEWRRLASTGDDAYVNFFKDRSRFVSEFGATSLPGPETFSQYNLTKAAWKPQKRWKTPMPSSLRGDETAWFTTRQFVHGQFQKRILEHYRRLWPVCGGTLHWKFNDPFSANTLGFGLMASIDPAERCKLSFYYAKRAYAPVAASLAEGPGRSVTAWVVNGPGRAFRGTLRVDVHDVSRPDQVSTALQQDIRVPADTSIQIARIDLKAAGMASATARKQRFFSLHLVDARGCDIYMDTHWLVNLPHEAGIELPKADLDVNIVRNSESQIEVSLGADRYCRPIELILGHAQCRYEDNFIDLLPGQTRTVTISRRPWDNTRLDNQILIARGWNIRAQTIPLG